MSSVGTKNDEEGTGDNCIKDIPTQTSLLRVLTNKNGSGRKEIDKSNLTLTYNNIKFEAPPDFRELLSEITKLCLEEQPENIPLFLARYFLELNERRVFQRQRELIAERKAAAKRAEEAHLEELRQAEIARKEAEAAELARLEAERQAELEFQAELARLAEEQVLQETALYITEETIKQSIAVEEESILRRQHKDDLTRLEDNKAHSIYVLSGEIEETETQAAYLDECIDTIYNHQLGVHLESLERHQAKAEEYRSRLAELEEFITKVDGIVKKLQAERPKLDAEKVVLAKKIETLAAKRTEMVKDYNGQIVQLEVKFKEDLEEIYKFLT